MSITKKKERQEYINNIIQQLSIQNNEVFTPLYILDKYSSDRILVNNYYIGSKDTVISFCHKDYKIKSISISNGYKYVRIKKDNLRLHRIKAISFMPIDQYNGLGMRDLVVNHIDSDKLNNDLKNLEWITQKENVIKYYQYLSEKNKGENKK